MDSDLERAYNLIASAVCAEEVFGKLIDTADRAKAPADVLEERYRSLSRTVDPEAYKSMPEDKELAWDAQAKLAKFFEKAKLLLEGGFYGARRDRGTQSPGARMAFKTPKRGYAIGSHVADGTISSVYEGECAIGDDFAGKIAIKIANDPADNDLLWREKRALSLLHAGNGRQRKHLPVLLDHFQTKDSQAALIFRNLDDCFTLSEMRDRYNGPEPERQRHMVWMLNRLLSAIGYAHSLGIVHCNIEPEHLMFHLSDHNLCIIDWCWAAISPRTTGDGFRIFTEGFTAPEAKEKASPLPSADLYSVGKCMTFFLGGNVETGDLPDCVEDDLKRLIGFLTLKSPHQRAQDAWEMHRHLDRTVKKLWGRKRFLDFPMQPER